MKASIRDARDSRESKKQFAQVSKDAQVAATQEVPPQRRFKIMMGDEQVFIIRADSLQQARRDAQQWILQRSSEFLRAHEGGALNVIEIPAEQS